MPPLLNEAAADEVLNTILQRATQDPDFFVFSMGKAPAAQTDDGPEAAAQRTIIEQLSKF